MISNRLRARWRALTGALRLDRLRPEPDQRARSAAASAAARDTHVDAEHRDSAATGGAR